MDFHLHFLLDNSLLKPSISPLLLSFSLDLNVNNVLDISFHTMKLAEVTALQELQELQIISVLTVEWKRLSSYLMSKRKVFNTIKN